MRVKVLFLVGLLCALCFPAHAEKVKTNQDAKVYNRPGEHGKIVVKVKEGQQMTLLAKEGRWLKVRVSGRTGYVPQSKVDMPEGEEEVARNTRRRPFVDGRGTKRGFNGEGGPDDRIGADAAGDAARSDEPDDKADKGDKGDDDPKPPKHGKSDKGNKGNKGDKGDKGDEPPKNKKPPQLKNDEDAVIVDDDEPKSAEEEPEADKPPARPTAHVSEKTPIYNDMDSDSGESFTASKKTVLIVSERKGKWAFVETDDGDAGYVLASKLDIEEPSDDGGGDGEKPTRVIDARARLGATLISQALRTPGAAAMLPDNYNVGSSSLTVALGGTVLYPYKSNFWLGGDLAYDYNRAIPGVSFMGKTTGFSLHNFNLRAVGGYDLHKKNGSTVYARLGYRYNSFQVADVSDLTKNTAKLPSEIISGPTIGAAFAIPRLTDTIGARVSLDTMLFGSSVSQTKGLEDGTGPSAKAVDFGLSGTYRWKPKMDFQATYDLNYTSLKFSGPAPATSMRGHTGTAASSRTDINHTLSVGIAYAF